MTERATVLVTGAGGFIGHHLTSYLAGLGQRVRGVDLKLPEYEPSRAAEFHLMDLRRPEACLEATEGIEQVYHLAANMGGIGFIERHKSAIVHDNLGAAGLHLSAEETAALDEASTPILDDYPYGELGVDQRDRGLPAPSTPAR